MVERWKLFLALMLGTSLENVRHINGGQESTFFEKTRFDWQKFGWMNTNTTITTVLGMIWYVNAISIFLPWQSHIYNSKIPFTIYSYLYIPMRLYWLQGDYGDVSPRKKIRTDNKCKSFKWYLTEVYPELFIPGEAIASGEVIFKFMLQICLLLLSNYAKNTHFW